MKKLITLLSFFIAMASLVVFQSCDDEEKPAAPTVTSPTGVAAVQINKTVDVTFEVEIPGGYSATQIGTVVGGTAAIKSEPAQGDKSGSVVITFTAGANEGAGVVPVTIVDKNNKPAVGSATIAISVDAPPTITLSAEAASVAPGATTKVNVTVTAPNGVSQILVTGATTTPASPIAQSGASPQVTEVTVSVPASAVVGSTINVVFQAKDTKNLLSSQKTFVITVAYPALTGNITTNTTLDATQKYLIKGQVFVKNGATLTIPAGTILKGERASKGTLIVEPGGRLVCNGTAQNPVVFTSDQAPNTRDKGDWGGVIILGSAWVNQSSLPSIEGISPSVSYGNTTSPATNADQNSGSLTYVRIEYAGIELTPNNETNSLTMGGVGSGTSIDYVQVSFGGDDGFEWFGGNVNAKHLISYGTWDDDFDTDFGWGGNVQYGVAIRYPFSADQSGSNAFESDNQGNANTTPGCNGTDNSGCTRGVFSNITVIGPRDFNTGLVRTGESATTRARAISNNFQHALHIRRRTAISIFNSVFAGFPAGLRIDDGVTLTNYTSGVGKLSNNILLVPSTNEVGSNTADLASMYVTNTASGDANAVKTYFTTGLNNSTSLPTNSNGWSVNPGTPAGSINPYTDLGLSSGLFWGQNLPSENPAAIDAYPVDPNFAVTSGTINTGAVYTDTKITGAGTFFETTQAQRGAFGATDWTNTWTNFRPGATNYN